MVEVKEQSAYLMVYTRKVLADSYPDGLARSVHMAVSHDGVCYTALNKNYGILFAEAEILPDNTLAPRGVKEPWMFEAEEGYGIAAVRVQENGTQEYESGADVLFWYTEDLISFEQKACVHLVADTPVEVVQCTWKEEKKRYELFWKDQEEKWYQAEVENLWKNQTVCGKQSFCEKKPFRWFQKPEGAEAGNILEIRSDVCARAESKWKPVVHTKTLVPDKVKVRYVEDLNSVRAQAVYSDGSVCAKKIKWDLPDTEKSGYGNCEITGTVYEEGYKFPLAVGYGDPVLFFWEGSWYFIATNDNEDDIALYARKADSVAELFAEETPQTIILDLDEEKDFMQTFWAPEFHVIGGELYILFAVSGKVWGPQCHMMKLKKGGEILNPEDWEEPVRVRKKDGSFLGETGITLDMTYLKTARASYMVWSYREHIGTPKDTGSMLYIAEIDENRPWQLTSDPVLLSRPLYGWENVSGTINNEGPHGFVKDHRVYLGYSGGSANSYTYAVGLLTADDDADLLCVENWKKSETPVLSFYSVEGEYGPGHHSFYTDEQGELMIAYHAEDALDHVIRCDGIRRVHFDIEGRPRFDMSVTQSLDPELCRIKIYVEKELGED